jgi:large subunit ribosomal protein L9
MKVILLEDVSNLGEMGETVTVKDGYARNFLIPRKLALPATARNLKVQEHHLKGLEQKREQAIENAKSMSDKLAGVSLSFSRKVGEKGRLFGSVTNMDIASALANDGIDIDRRQIILEEHIKQLGEHEVTVKLRSEVSTTITVTVLPEEGSELPLEPAEGEEAAEGAEPVDESAEAAEEAPEAEAAPEAAEADAAPQAADAAEGEEPAPSDVEGAEGPEPVEGVEGEEKTEES